MSLYRLQVSISADKKQLSELEDKILKLLKESSGNILDDEQLINTLNHSKLTSGVISVRFGCMLDSWGMHAARGRRPRVLCHHWREGVARLR